MENIINIKDVKPKSSPQTADLNELLIVKSEGEYLKVLESYIYTFINSNYKEDDSFEIERNMILKKAYKIAKDKNYIGIDKSIIWQIYLKVSKDIKCSKMNENKDVTITNDSGVKSTFKFDLNMKGLLTYDNDNNLIPTPKGYEVIAQKFVEVFGLRSGEKSVDGYLPAEGIWTTTTKGWLNKIVNETIIQKTGTYLSNKAITEIVKRIYFLAFNVDYKENIFNEKYMRLTFNNGTLDLATNIFYNEFFKEDYSTVKIPYNYREDLKDTRPIKLDKFLSLMLDNETIELIYEVIGSIFIKKYMPKKFFILYGAGNNGKTTLLKLLEHLAGKRNTSYVTLEAIADTEQKFHRIELMGRLINVCGEIPGNYVLDTHLMKMLTGEDKFMAERKGVDPVRFYNFANIFLSCNKIPRFNDNTKGWRDRLTIIPMQKPFKENAQSKVTNPEGLHIDAIINDTELMETVIAYSIQKFQQTGYGEKLTESPAVEEIMKEYYQEDPINSFIEDHYDITGNTDDRLLCKDILLKFYDYRDEELIGLSMKFNANSFGHGVQERYSDKVTYKAKFKLLGCSKTRSNVLLGIKEKDFTQVEDKHIPEEFKQNTMNI